MELLSSTGNATQCFVIACKGKELEREHMCVCLRVCVHESLCFKPEIKTTL